MKVWSGEGPINLGSGQEVTIADLARLIADVIGFEGRLVFDGSKPEGASRRALDSARLADTGWRAPTPLREGLEATYRWWRGQAP